MFEVVEHTKYVHIIRSFIASHNTTSNKSSIDKFIFLLSFDFYLLGFCCYITISMDRRILCYLLIKYKVFTYHKKAIYIGNQQFSTNRTTTEKNPYTIYIVYSTEFYMSLIEFCGFQWLFSINTVYYQEPIKKQMGRSVKHPRKKSNSVCTAYYNEVTINNACQTTPQHDMAWLLERPAAAKPGATKNKRLPARKKATGG